MMVSMALFLSKPSKKPELMWIPSPTIAPGLVAYSKVLACNSSLTSSKILRETHSTSNASSSSNSCLYFVTEGQEVIGIRERY